MALFNGLSLIMISYLLQPKNKPLPSGVYNASACRFGAPIFMSQPHFYQADPYFAEQVNLAGSVSLITKFYKFKDLSKDIKFLMEHVS